MGLFNNFFKVLYLICTSRYEVQKSRVKLFTLQHSGTYNDYNDKPHGKFYGLTPNEVLHEMNPAKVN